jgi:hypothetical protein
MEGRTLRERVQGRGTEGASELAERFRAMAQPLGTPHDLNPLLERIGDARCVLLGEASHGTAEYYSWRRQITERLICERGFSFVAVEGDWPDCYRVNRYVKGAADDGASAQEVLHAFSRWPTWMWANQEIVGLVLLQSTGHPVPGRGSLRWVAGSNARSRSNRARAAATPSPAAGDAGPGPSGRRTHFAGSARGRGHGSGCLPRRTA